jgi:hypothetical protein
MTYQPQWLRLAAVDNDIHLSRRRASHVSRKHLLTWLWALCHFVVAIWIAQPPAYGQEVTAALNGTVTDASGAAVVGATITATDLDRGTAWPTVTNGSGSFNLPRLPVGRYEVRAEKSGFQTAVRSDIELQLNQGAKVGFVLQVGSTNQAIDVTAAPPLLQTEGAQLGTVIDARTNAQLPLATRNYVQLTLLSAGAVTPNPAGFRTTQTFYNLERPYINGNREQTNNFLLDGLDNNQVSDNLVAYTPSVDAVQEFNEITQNASAEFGNFMGGITSVSIKSGTNKVHGNAFEFIRNDDLNANDWASNFEGHPRPVLRWNEFGGSIGGPIKRDKLFVFGDYQGSRYDQPATAGAFTVLTNQERQGNFSQLSTQLYNPYSLDAKGNRIPFAGNVIPANLFSRVSSTVLNSSYYPAPINGNLINNQINTTRSFINGDQGDVKVDWNLSDKDRVFGRYSQSYVNSPTINSQPLSYNSYGNYPIHNGVLDYTRTISPSIVNDLRFGANYTVGSFGTSTGDLGNLPQEFGISGAISNILPSLGTPGGNASGVGSSGSESLFATTVIQYEDTAIISKGNHTFQVGFQGFRERIDTLEVNVAGTFTFNGQFTAATGHTFGGGTGQPEADFLLGLPSNVSAGVNGGDWGQRANIFGAFVQDNWRVSNNLTINLGVRYEIHTPWAEVYNRQSNFAPFTGQIETAGESSYYNNNRALYNQYNGPLNFQPRLGIAWTPGGGHTVLRASYTMSSYMEGTGTYLRLPLNPPFTPERVVDYTSYGLPPTTLDQGFAAIGSPTNVYAGANLRLWDPNVRPAVSNQWNFTLQHQFGNSTTLQAAYVGQKNDHLVVAQAYLQKQLLPDGTIADSPYLSGNPALQSVVGEVSGTETNGNQSYNALQVTLQKRLANGLQGQFAYTWSKCMTDSTGFYGEGAQAASASPYSQNLYNRQAEWGPCYYDLTHNVSAYFSYDLPFGRNRAFGKNWNRAVNGVLGGWQVNGILSFHDGFPLTISAPDNSGTNSQGSRADCIAPAQVYGARNSPAGGYQWFDQASYGPAAAGTFGTCGVGTVRGPGLSTADVSFLKTFEVTEHQRLELRSEFINFTNTPVLQAPNVALGTNLGLIQTSQGARNIQFGLKYSF